MKCVWLQYWLVANGDARDTGSGNHRQKQEEKRHERLALSNEQGGNDRRRAYSNQQYWHRGQRGRGKHYCQGDTPQLPTSMPGSQPTEKQPGPVVAKADFTGFAVEGGRSLPV